MYLPEAADRCPVCGADGDAVRRGGSGQARWQHMFKVIWADEAANITGVRTSLVMPRAASLTLTADLPPFHDPRVIWVNFLINWELFVLNLALD